MKKNVILLDWFPGEDWSFDDFLSEYTGRSWERMCIRANERRKTKLGNFLNIHMKYIFYPLYVFFNRKKFENIIAWQQFFGIFLAFYCKLFRAREYPKIIILTFIYKQKSGFVGKLYYNFMKRIVQSKYVHKIICYSSNEREYYIKCFHLDPEKIACITFGMSSTLDLEKYKSVGMGKYFLSAGRSNRDYDFLINALKDSGKETIILCGEPKAQKMNSITVYNNVPEEEYLKYLANCFAVIIPLKDENISSGQLVFIKAMEFGKPIVVTQGNAIKDYIFDGYNGIIIEKTKNELLAALNKLENDSTCYQELSDHCKALFQNKFSMKGFAETVAKYIQ